MLADLIELGTLLVMQLYPLSDMLTGECTW